jgi:hypothetical protein
MLLAAFFVLENLLFPLNSPHLNVSQETKLLFASLLAANSQDINYLIFVELFKKAIA